MKMLKGRLLPATTTNPLRRVFYRLNTFFTFCCEKDLHHARIVRIVRYINNATPTKDLHYANT